MRKVLKACLYGLTAAMLLAGCSKKVEEDSVKLGNYKGVEYTPAAVEVTDEQVESAIQNLIDQYPIITEVDRAAELGDIVNIDFEGLKDGVAFEGGASTGYDLTLGSRSLIDGFEDGLVGAVKGQELSLDLTFPEDYNEELGGQDVVFNVTVNSVKESTPPELTDDFIKANTESETIDEYKEAARADLLLKAEANAESKKNSDVFFKVIEDSEITITDASVDAYYDEQMAVYEKQAQASGLDLETMIGYYGMDLETFKAQQKTMAQEATKQNLVVNAIAAAENITVTPEDMDQLAIDFNYENKEVMLEQAGESVVNNYILTDKVVKFIAENAVGV